MPANNFDDSDIPRMISDGCADDEQNIHIENNTAELDARLTAEPQLLSQVDHVQLSYLCGYKTFSTNFIRKDKETIDLLTFFCDEQFPSFGEVARVYNAEIDRIIRTYVNGKVNPKLLSIYGDVPECLDIDSMTALDTIQIHAHEDIFLKFTNKNVRKVNVIRANKLAVVTHSIPPSVQLTIE